MNARYLKISAINELAKKVPQNLDRYFGAGFDHQELSSTLQSNASELIKVNTELLDTLKADDSNTNYEAYNSITVFKAIEGISRFQANDPGLWTYLSHTVGQKFLAARYKKKFDSCKTPTEQTAVVRQHFFCNRSSRDIRRNQGLARLWWGGALMSDFKSISAIEAADAVLTNSDIRASILERPNFTLNNGFESAVAFLVKKKKENPDSNFFTRNNPKTGKTHFCYRQMCKEINILGGHKNLQMLTVEEITEWLSMREAEYSKDSNP